MNNMYMNKEFSKAVHFVIFLPKGGPKTRLIPQIPGPSPERQEYYFKRP
jgi:hypothetical protein